MNYQNEGFLFPFAAELLAVESILKFIYRYRLVHIKLEYHKYQIIIRLWKAWTVGHSSWNHKNFKPRFSIKP